MGRVVNIRVSETKVAFIFFFFFNCKYESPVFNIEREEETIYESHF